jgi:hypothetical protein
MNANTAAVASESSDGASSALTHMIGMLSKGGAESVAIERWFATAALELGRHTAGVDGLCRTCGAAWPCPRCERAAFALGSG